jgi:hypothetical protein
MELTMQCPHCSKHFHDNTQASNIYYMGNYTHWDFISSKCPACEGLIIELEDPQRKRQIVHPIGGGSRGAVPPQVPKEIAADYVEACKVLPLSPKASAALSRRCLQSILDEKGYQAQNLATQIDLLINESDTTKAIPESLRTTIDGIRNFGNFSAHPITDTTTLQIINVEPHEAEWCLEILEEIFQHYYVKPAEAKARKAKLDTKLVAAGKPPSK